jgi:hypothetical protein
VCSSAREERPYHGLKAIVIGRDPVDRRRRSHRFVDKSVQQAQRFRHPRSKRAREYRGLQAPPDLHKESVLEGMAQRAQHSTHRGLADPEAARGRGDALRLEQRRENRELPGIEIGNGVNHPKKGCFVCKSCNGRRPRNRPDSKHEAES